MDLVAILAIVRRHRWIVASALALVAGAVAGVVFATPKQYESTAQYVLISPPPAPSDAQIQRDPGLGRLNSDNPYLRVPSPSVVVDVLAQRVSGDTVRQALINQGADKDYQIAGTNAVGSGMVISIVGTGHSAALSRRTTGLVASRMQTELHDMQKVNGADDRFLIQALPIGPTADPVRKITSTIRAAIATLAGGMVLLFVVVSVAEARSVRRTRVVSTVPMQRAAPPDPAPPAPPASAASPVSPASAASPVSPASAGSARSAPSVVARARVRGSLAAADEPGASTSEAHAEPGDG
ncbi:MAG: hypothetical protein QOE03_1910 [Micromonosporaceae bacterium]|nr:hypothetical protein [Micromonosporaceae bacterium]